MWGGDVHRAEDVVQTVFIDLARNARALPPSVLLGGWLHRHTCFVSSTLMRTERRRKIREQQAMLMNSFDSSSDNGWHHLEPVIDGALDQLDKADRNALILRFFEQRSFRTMGEILGISDDAAQKRVARALERLRECLKKRGVTLSITALSLILGKHAIQAAPAALTAHVAAAALAAPAVGPLTLLYMKMMASAKLQLALSSILLTAAILIPAFYQKAHSGEPDKPVLAAEVTAQKTKPDQAKPPIDKTTSPTKETTRDDLNKSVLHLTVLAADTGRPLSDVSIWTWGSNGLLNPKWTTDENGNCEIPVDVNGKEDLHLTMHKKLFSCTRLLWRPKSGDVIPANYTLKMTRAIHIAGQVVDPDGQPLEGATVSAGYMLNGKEEKQVETHFLDHVDVLTDANGHWEIDEVAEGLLPFISVSADHSIYLGASSSCVRNYEVQKQLCEGTLVMQMSRGGIVSGIVMNANNQSVSNVDILVGEISDVSSKRTKTGPDGSFSLSGCRLEENLVTAEMDGYAPTTVAIFITSNTPSCKLVLKQGRPFLFRVVDEEGQPIENARIYLDYFNQWPSAQTFVNLLTGKDGRVSWNNAPEGTNFFDFNAVGYAGTNHIPIVLDDQEHVVTLRRTCQLKISGNVIDSVTRKAIQQFDLFYGDAKVNEEGNCSPVWSPVVREILHFRNGVFEDTRPQARGESLGCFIKIKADGYAPYVSRMIRTNETDVTLNVELRRVDEKVVQVISPSLQPITRADIGFVTPNSGLEMVPGGFDAVSTLSQINLRRTDPKGLFRLSSDPDITHVVIAAPEGVLVTTPDELKARPIAKLKPWARLEATLEDTNQASKLRMFVELVDFPRSSLSFKYNLSHMPVDATGKCVWPQLPPGRFYIGFTKDIKENPDRQMHVETTPIIEVHSGTTTISIQR